MLSIVKIVGKARQWHLFALTVCWVLIYYYHQRYLPRRHVERCQWARWNNNAETHNVLLVADPQLIDNHTYPSYHPFFLSVTKHTSDEYLRRNFKYLSKVLKPDAVIFLGDYQDNGRSSSDLYYAREMERFHRIFRNYNSLDTSKFVTSLPGNHDIGWKNGITEHSLERFEQTFGDPVPYDMFGTLVVPVNSLALSNTENEKIYGKPQQLLKQIGQQKKDTPRILLTHVPLMRPKEASCGSLREAKDFPYVAGYQYQTVLDELVSKDILESVKPDLVFSGDDHDYCFVDHKYIDNGIEKTVSEVTVKSISMTMGISSPAVQLLTISKNIKQSASHDYHTFGTKDLVFNTEICLLPAPYKDIISYVGMAVFSGLAIIINTYFTVNKPKRYFGYSRVQSNSIAPSFVAKWWHAGKSPVENSPYASTGSTPLESFSISIAEDHEADDIYPINNYRRRPRAKTTSKFYGHKKSFRILFAKAVSIVISEFILLGSIAMLLYFFFIYST